MPLTVTSICTTKPLRFCHTISQPNFAYPSFPHKFIKKRSLLKDTWKLLALHFSAFRFFSTFLKLSPWQHHIHSFACQTFQCSPRTHSLNLVGAFPFRNLVRRGRFSLTWPAKQKTTCKIVILETIVFYLNLPSRC